MRWILLGLALSGCGGVPSGGAWSQARSASLGVIEGQLYDGQPSSAVVDVSGCVGCDLVLLVSPTTGQGPCYRGTCLDLGPAGRVVAREAVTRRGALTLDFDLTVFGVAAGQSLSLQAALVDRGRIVARSPVTGGTVEATVPGCAFSGAPSFDPAATLEDGSCECYDVTTVGTAADLAAVAGCVGVGAVILEDFVDPVAVVPGSPASVRVQGAPGPEELVLADAVALDALEVAAGLGVERVAAPQLEVVDLLHLPDVPALIALELPALLSHNEIVIGGASLSDVDLPALWRGGILLIERNQVPVRVSAPVAEGFGLGLQDNLGGVVLEAPSVRAAYFSLAGASGLASTALPAVDELVVDLTGADLGVVDAGPATEVWVTAVGGALTEIVATNATSGSFDLWGAAGFTTLSAPSLVHAARVGVVGAPAMVSLDLPALVDASWIELRDNTSLAAVSVPSLVGWHLATLIDNPAWCVGAPFDAPGPEAVVEASGNLCDP